MTYDLTDRLLFTKENDKKYTRYVDTASYLHSKYSKVEKYFKSGNRKGLANIFPFKKNTILYGNTHESDREYTESLCLSRIFPETNQAKVFDYYSNRRVQEQCECCGIHFNFFNKSIYGICKACNTGHTPLSSIQSLMMASKDEPSFDDLDGVLP